MTETERALKYAIDTDDISQVIMPYKLPEKEIEDDGKLYLVNKFGPENNPSYKFRWGNSSNPELSEKWLELAQETSENLIWKELHGEQITRDEFAEMGREEKIDFLLENPELLKMFSEESIGLGFGAFGGQETIADFLAENK